MWYMRICARVSRGGGSNDSGVVNDGNFRRFMLLFHRKL